MASGKFGPASVTIALEDSPGGTTRAMTGFVLSGIDIGHEAETAETTGFGVSFREHTPTGMNKHDDIELFVTWDTGTDLTHDALGTVDDGPQDDGRELIVVFGDGKIYTIDVRLVKFTIGIALDNIQTATAMLRPTGTGAWTG